MINEVGMLAPTLHHERSVQRAVEAAAEHRHLVWVALESPSAEEFRGVLRDLGCSPHAAEVLRRHIGHIGAVMIEGVVVLALPNLKQTQPGSTFVGLHLIAGKGFIAACRQREDLAATTAIRREAERALFSAGAANPGAGDDVTGWGMLGAMMTAAFERYDDVFDTLEDSVDDLVARVFPDPADDVEEGIYEASRTVLLAIRVIRPIERGLDTLLNERDRLAIDADSVGRVMRARSEATDLLERVTWLDNALDSLVDAVMVLSWRKANELGAAQTDAATRLTAYAALLAVPAVVFGLYGTNFHNIWLLRQAWGYPATLLAIALIEIFLWSRFRRRGWL
jgi:magnesium transporter